MGGYGVSGGGYGVMGVWGGMGGYGVSEVNGVSGGMGSVRGLGGYGWLWGQWGRWGGMGRSGGVPEAVRSVGWGAVGCGVGGASRTLGVFVEVGDVDAGGRLRPHGADAAPDGAFLHVDDGEGAVALPLPVHLVAVHLNEGASLAPRLLNEHRLRRGAAPLRGAPPAWCLTTPPCR